jgi:outer membrane protein OmpA-like peptidoglycan-associated protein
MTGFRINARRALQAALIVGLAAAAPDWAVAQGQEDECTFWPGFQAAIKAPSFAEAAALEEKIAGEPDCNDRAVAAKDAMLGLYLNQDAQWEHQKAPLTKRLEQLKAALKYTSGRNAWDVNMRIGDLLRKLPKQDYAAISLSFDAAVRSIDMAPESARPPQAVIERAVLLASQYDALSPTPVPRRALFSRAARSVFVDAVPATLQFEFDSDKMTKAGEGQAENLFKQLQAQSMPRILIVGHTDPIGTFEYNDELSLRRAVAFKNYLIAHSYPADRITTEGRGKRDVDKLKIADRKAFTVDQVNQMLRRVELVWKQN